MMELIRQKLIKNSLFFIIVGLASCNLTTKNRQLECLLNSLNINNYLIEIGQHNGWTDSTSLITLDLHVNGNFIPINSQFEGKYKSSRVFYYQTQLGAHDSITYNLIPNEILWEPVKRESIDTSKIKPPYDPINIQIEYNFKRDQWGKILKGEEYLNYDLLLNCDS